MGNRFKTIREGIGQFNPFRRLKLPRAAPRYQPDPSALGQAPNAGAGAGDARPFSKLTPEEIQQRNYATLAQASFDKPLHEHVLDFLKETWRIVGPIAFVLFTAWEVYYYLHHFMAQDNSLTTQILLWGITLLIEIPFMMATYDQSTRKKRAMEAREQGHYKRLPDAFGSVAMWFLLAGVNIAGQIAFLVLITQVGSVADPTPLYLFIGIRVLGVLLGDAYTAFYLLPPETTISRVVRHQKAQGEGLAQLSEAAIERQRKESQAELDLKRNQNTIRREQNEARFLEQFSELNMRQALENQRRFLQPGRVERIEEVEGPDTGDL